MKLNPGAERPATPTRTTVIASSGRFRRSPSRGTGRCGNDPPDVPDVDHGFPLRRRVTAGLRSPSRADPVFLSIFLGNALVLAYSLLEVRYGATPGKMMLRLRIQNQAAAPATTAPLLARYAMKHAAGSAA